MQRRGKEKLIGEVLLEQDVITREQLAEALKIQKERGGRIVQVLINLGYLTEEALLGCLGSQQGVTSVNLRQYTIDPDLVNCVPLHFALKYEIMPLDRLGKNLTVAMAVPMDHATQEKLEELTDLRIRAVLCARSDVRAAIEQYYGVSPISSLNLAAETSVHQGVVAVESIEVTVAPQRDVRPGPEAVRLRNVTDILETVDAFPLLPRVHTQVLQVLGQPDASVGQMAELIQQDPTLATNMLKLANSAAYAARNRFDNVQRAVAYIGLRELHSMIISSAVLQAISEKTRMDLDQLFQQAFRCGMLTKIVSDAAKLEERDMAFTAGLLHDLGTIVLRYFCQERLLDIDRIVKESGRPRHEVEEEVLGIAASEVAYHLMKRWNIPETLEEAIRFHDRLDSAPEASPVSAAIALALHCLAQEAAGVPFAKPDAEGVAESLLARLGLKSKALKGIEQQYHDALENITPLNTSAG